MRFEHVSIPVCFDLSFLRIRWSDRVLAKESNKIVGEGVVYGGNWVMAERLARQMTEMKFGAKRGSLPVCEQIFITGKKEEGRRKKEVQEIASRGSNLKVKVGRNVFDDIKTLEHLKNDLKFPNQIRIDANQGYSLKQLQYIIPTLKQLRIVYVEEPVRIKDLPAAADLLHRYGLKIILDESLNLLRSDLGVRQGLTFLDYIDAINIKLSRVGDINQAIHLIKLAKKHSIKVVIGCSEELERGMEAIYALGKEAEKAGILLEVEGFGPLRLRRKVRSISRLMNKVENFYFILSHRVRQQIFDLWWIVCRCYLLLVKASKKLSSLSLRLVQWTGKHPQKIHPKHLISRKYDPEYLSFISMKDIVLDIGCNNGQNTILTAKRARSVHGFDTDPLQLQIAKTDADRLGIRNITFRIGNAERRFPYSSDMFDSVMFLGVLEHLNKRRESLAEVLRVLKPRGLLFLGVPNEQTSWKTAQQRFGIQHYTDPDHKIEYTRIGIAADLEKSGFKVTNIFPTAYDTPWAGLIDIVGGLSLSFYERLILWKWRGAKENLQESISFLVIAQKK